MMMKMEPRFYCDWCEDEVYESDWCEWEDGNMKDTQYHFCCRDCYESWRKEDDE